MIIPPVHREDPCPGSMVCLFVQKYSQTAICSVVFCEIGGVIKSCSILIGIVSGFFDGHMLDGECYVSPDLVDSSAVSAGAGGGAIAMHTIYM